MAQNDGHVVDAIYARRSINVEDKAVEREKIIKLLFEETVHPESIR